MALTRPIVAGARLILGLVGVGLGLATVRVIGSDPAAVVPEVVAGRGALVLAGGWSLIAVGVGFLSRPGRRRSSLLRIAGGYAWFAGYWTQPTAPALLFTAGLVTGGAAAVLAGHAELSEPRRSWLRGSGRAIVLLGYLSTIGTGLVVALFYDPLVEHCSACPGNPLLTTAEPEIVHAAGRVTILGGMIWPAALACVIAAQMLRGGRSSLVWDGPATVPMIVYLAAVWIDITHAAGGWFLASDPFTDRLHQVQAVALVLAALGNAWPMVRSRQIRVRIATLVARSPASGRPADLSGALGVLLHDPTVRVRYPLETGDLVTADGRIDPGEPGDLHIRLHRNGRLLAVLTHRRRWAAGPRLAEEIAAAASLSLDAERLLAQRRAQVAEIEASRDRIERAAQDERRRLERDLHDGAQQHLVLAAVAVQLALLRSADPGRVAGLVAIRDDLNAALDDLRGVSHGLRHPVPTVVVEGLAPAGAVR